MKIAINTLATGSGGNKFYAKMLIKTLAKIDRKNQYLVLVNSLNKKSLQIKASNFKFLILNLKNPFLRIFWEQIFLPFVIRKHKIEILHNFSSFDILLAPCKTIITINNMIPYSKKALREEKLLRKIKFVLLRFIGKFSEKAANHVITLSQTAKKRLIQKYHFNPNKISSIYLGIANSSFLMKTPSNKIKKYLKKDFCLLVSHINRYKKIKEVILAYKQALNQNSNIPLLYIIGKSRDKKYFLELKKIIQKENLKTKVFLIRPIPRKNLSFFYQNTKFLIFNSLVETCPLTLIEAMRFGTPILCARASVMPEICQKAALYFNPSSPKDMAGKINQLAKNKNLAQDLSKESQERSIIFTWEKTAQKTLDVFKNIYNEP